VATLLPCASLNQPQTLKDLARLSCWTHNLTMNAVIPTITLNELKGLVRLSCWITQQSSSSHVVRSLCLVTRGTDALAVPTLEVVHPQTHRGPRNGTQTSVENLQQLVRRRGQTLVCSLESMTRLRWNGIAMLGTGRSP
jgi:hypothetical protein